MKLFKSLLLASATGLVAVSGASAADLGAKKPSPVEYVRACYNPLWGTSGGFIIPGTQTCVRVFGRARFDMHYSQPYARANSPLGYRGGMDVGLDAITPSEYGNVRAFAQIGAVYRSGNQRSGTNVRNGYAIDGTFPAGTNSGGQTEINYTGFIQFAGFTMGRTNSFFATVGAPTGEVIGTTMRSSPGNVSTIAYTAQLGNGFLATIALEDPTVRRFGVARGSSTDAAGNINFLNGITGFGAAVTNFQQIGNRMPSLVAALRVDQAWGSAELSGMVNEVGLVGAIPGTFPSGGLGFSPSSKYGFAINAGLKINLPMIAAGDNLTLNAVYTEGLTSSVFSNPLGNSFQFANVGAVAVVTPDATFNAATGQFRLTKAWGVTAGFQHFWTPTISSLIFGSYGQVDVANQPLRIDDTLRDFTYWNVGLNTIWQPVRGLNIALEGVYVNLDPKGRMLDLNKHTAGNGTTLIGLGCALNANGTNNAACRTKSSDSQFITRLRITRDF
jgi:hypothetical protein